MKAHEVMRLLRISRPTLQRYGVSGLLERVKLPNGHYDYTDESVYRFLNKDVKRKTVIYGRVSTPKQRHDLENQLNMLKSWAVNSGNCVDEVYADIASGISFEHRTEFFKMLDQIMDHKVDKVIVAYKDRLSRVGFELFHHLFLHFGTEIIVVSGVGNTKLDSEEIFDEIISMLHCYAMKHYSKRKTNPSGFTIEVDN